MRGFFSWLGFKSWKYLQSQNRQKTGMPLVAPRRKAVGPSRSRAQIMNESEAFTLSRPLWELRCSPMAYPLSAIFVAVSKT
jgi:hypothetical protein